MSRGTTQGDQGMPRGNLTRFVPSLEETSRQNLGLPWYHLREYKEARKPLVSPNMIAASIIFLNLLKNNERKFSVWPFVFLTKHLSWLSK